ncbi:MAG: hypothetical protein V4708_09660 [Bacteroidota bacterium]
MKYSFFFEQLAYWNRRLHIHIGLFLLLFIWLFSFSGLLLNNSTWKFASFWNQKKENKTTSTIAIPKGLDSLETLQRIMVKLNISGEITNVKMTQDSIDFRVHIPGHIKNIHVDFQKGVYTLNEMRFNIWGKLRTLHTFNGSNGNKPGLQGNWIITQVWKFSMDAISIGLIYLCISSWVMWYRIRKNYRWGSIVLSLGFASVLYFVYLLRIL